jgi:hypothetical protein
MITYRTDVILQQFARFKSIGAPDDDPGSGS